jgi:hypothetical protein
VAVVVAGVVLATVVVSVVVVAVEGATLVSVVETVDATVVIRVD